MSRYFCLLMIGSGLAGFVSAAMPGQDAEGVEVVRAYFSDPDSLRALSGLLEPWSVNKREGFFIAEVTAEEREALLALGFRVETDPALTARYHRRNQPLTKQLVGIPGFPCYLTVEETFAFAQDLVTEHPDLAQWVDIGDSWERTQDAGAGWDMMVLVLTNNAVPGPKPKIFVMSAVHAREYAPAGLNAALAAYLVDAYGEDADATWLMDHHEFHLLLQANPDGRKRAETALSWRKNADNDFCTDSNLRGIDLNRNFSFEWGDNSCSSPLECSNSFRGPAPASEPETFAIEAYAATIFPDVRGPAIDDPAPEDASGIFLDLHSYGGQVLWPYGFDPVVAPNGTALQTLGRKLAWFNGYSPEKASQSFNTCGTTDDFAYGVLGVAAYTMEVGNAFFQDCTIYESRVLPDNLAALLYAAKAARTPYLTPAGPDTTHLALSAGAVLLGETFTISADIDDTRFRNTNGAEPVQPIAAAEYYLDLPPWDPAAPLPVAFSASDGSFNTPIEAVQAELDTSTVTTGDHILYCRGQDSGGHWGAVSAAFFSVLAPETAPLLQGSVREIASGDAVLATITAGPYQVSSAPADGTYELVLLPGSYDILVAADGYVPVTLPGLMASESQTIDLDFVMLPICESDVLGRALAEGHFVADGGWAREPDDAAVWSDSPAGPYARSSRADLVTPYLDFSELRGARLTFSHRYDIDDAGDDHAALAYALDGGTWVELRRFTGYQPDWRSESIDLACLEGHRRVRLRFALASDGYFEKDGWSLRDLALVAGSSGCTFVSLLANWPNEITVLDLVDLIGGAGLHARIIMNESE